MKVKADLHNHIRTGRWFKDKDFNLAVDIASERLGTGGIIGLVNSLDKRYETFSGLKGYERVFLDDKKAIYIPEKDLTVVRGEEIPTKRGHVLALGLNYDKNLRGGRLITETVMEIKDNGGIAVLVHPFYRNGPGKYVSKDLSLLKGIDAIEIHNGEAALYLPGLTPKDANKQSEKFCKNLKSNYPDLGMLSSSDGHSFYEIGSSWTELDIQGYKSFIKNLREAINKTSPETHSQRRNYKWGALDHIADLAFISAMVKAGIKNLD